MKINVDNTCEVGVGNVCNVPTSSSDTMLMATEKGLTDPLKAVKYSELDKENQNIKNSKSNFENNILDVSFGGNPDEVSSINRNDGNMAINNDSNEPIYQVCIYLSYSSSINYVLNVKIFPESHS